MYIFPICLIRIRQIDGKKRNELRWCKRTSAFKQLQRTYVILVKSIGMNKQLNKQKKASVDSFECTFGLPVISSD